MPESSNYIKVRSGRSLRRQNAESQQRIQIAGSNDISNQPGANGIHTPIRTLTGVLQPGQYEVSAAFFGETLTTRTGGMGSGGVEMPPLKPRAALDARDAIYPFNYNSRWLGQNKVSDSQDLPFSQIVAGSVEVNPSEVVNSGSIVNALERTTSLDGNRATRARESRKEWIRRALRGK